MNSLFRDPLRLMVCSKSYGAKPMNGRLGQLSIWRSSRHQAWTPGRDMYQSTIHGFGFLQTPDRERFAEDWKCLDKCISSRSIRTEVLYWLLMSMGATKYGSWLTVYLSLPTFHRWVGSPRLRKPLPTSLLHCNSMGCYRLSFTARSAYFFVLLSHVAFMFCIVIAWLLAWQSIFSPWFTVPTNIFHQSLMDWMPCVITWGLNGLRCTSPQVNNLHIPTYHIHWHIWSLHLIFSILPFSSICFFSFHCSQWFQEVIFKCNLCLLTCTSH